MLEAGPDYPTPDVTPPAILDARQFGGVEHDWGYLADGMLAGALVGPGFGLAAGQQLPVPAGRVVGGSSAVNGTNAIRPQPADFDRWVGLGNDAWSWQDVLPYFARTEDDPIGGPWHGADGPVAVRRFSDAELRPLMGAFVTACTSAGYPRHADMNAPGAPGVGALPVNQVDGVRQSTALTYLGPARARPNLTLRAGVTVDRLEIRDGRVRGLRLATGEQIGADVVVLCAGAIGSPAVLQRSGVGPEAVLTRLGIRCIHRLEGVGRNLREHPMPYPTWLSDAEEPGPPLQVILTSAASGPSGGDIELNVVPLIVKPGTFTAAIPLMRPYSVGRVELAAAHPYLPPRIELNLYDHVDDVRRAVRALRIVRSLVASAALRGHVGDELWPGLDITSDAAIAAALTATPTAGAHVSGTCAMGPEPSHWSVVDQFGAVHGLDGLCVVDASIMPVLPAAPPHMTVIMVAERCAAELAARLCSHRPA